MAKLFENPRSIAIEGPIRAGKSTLATLLAQEIGATRIVEPQHNPFLPRFYRGEKSTAFPAQMWFLMSRYEQLCAAAEQDAKAGKSAPVVADYIFEKDKLFACLNLSDDELALYERQYQYFRDQLPTPDLVIYLQASPQVLRTRLERKGLADERTISGSYLEQVVAGLRTFLLPLHGQRSADCEHGRHRLCPQQPGSANSAAAADGAGSGHAIFSPARQQRTGRHSPQSARNARANFHTAVFGHVLAGVDSNAAIPPADA